MLNRALKVSVIKNDKQVVDSEFANGEFYRRVTYVTDEVKSITKRFGIGIAGYVILDTVRKVLVEIAKK